MARRRKAQKVLTHEEVLVILSQQAKDGSVTAAAALERALRATLRKEDEVGDAIERLLAG